jgi:hypothetical protein
LGAIPGGSDGEFQTNSLPILTACCYRRKQVWTVVLYYYCFSGWEQSEQLGHTPADPFGRVRAKPASQPPNKLQSPISLFVSGNKDTLNLVLECSWIVRVLFFSTPPYHEKEIVLYLSRGEKTNIVV